MSGFLCLGRKINKMQKIVLIGPVYPYKGGISHYTSLLYRALVKNHDVEMISYKMQYPRFLFRKEQKDFSNDLFQIKDTKFWIHTANPFNIICVGQRIRKMKPDMVIIQWWHPYFAPCYYLICKCLRKIKVLFICHNVFPHERFPLDRLLTKQALKNGNAFIVHSKQDGEDLLSIQKNAVFRYNPHPTYNVFKIKNLTKTEAKDALQIANDKKVLLFFGYVRAYKGLKHLLCAMPAIQEQLQNVVLFVVGSFSNDKEEYEKIIRNKGIEDCVGIIDGYIPDDEVEKYFAACDLVVLPYESATQSGIVQIAYGFEKPVIVTNVGGLPDVVKNGKTGYVVEPMDSEALAEAVIDFYEHDKAGTFEKAIKQEAHRFSWDMMEEVVTSLC